MVENQPAMKWKASLIRYHHADRIAVAFGNDPELIRNIKLIADARWNPQKKFWHIPDTFENRERFNIAQKVDNEPSLEGKEHLREFIRWLSAKRYSPSTIDTYGNALKLFLGYYRNKKVCEITNADVLDFNNDYILQKNRSASYQNQVTNAIKLYFRTVRGAKIEVDKIDRPKKPKMLPNVLSKHEVKNILEARQNIKHKTMLSLIYSCGLRRSELLHLKPQDIDSKRNEVLIRQSKGRKDRITPLSGKILDLLREYYKAFRPQTWLFEGQAVGEPYSEQSLQNVLRSA